MKIYIRSAINTDSINMKAGADRSCEWLLRGYTADGEDVTAVRIEFQDDVRKAVSAMFSDREIDTVDLYKIVTEYDTTGAYEDEEYFDTFTRADL